MENNLGTVFKVKYGHSQFGENVSEQGLIFFKSYKNFIFDNIDQRIVYSEDFIKTINKKNKQIIYDEPIENELTIFDFLFSGNYLDEFDNIIF